MTHVAHQVAEQEATGARVLAHPERVTVHLEHVDG